jgi:hypothetical protein
MAFLYHASECKVMATDEMLQCRADCELAESVDQYRERAGHEHQTDAVESLIRAGLREQRRPLLSRWREQVINWAGLLGVFALIALASGFVAPGIPAATGYAMSTVLVVFAVVLVSALEAARVVTGQSEIGQFVREVVG